MKRLCASLFLAAVAALGLACPASAGGPPPKPLVLTPKVTLSKFQDRLLNPQPLPPKEALRLRLRLGNFDRYLLNPQPLPPRPVPLLVRPMIVK